MAAISIPLEYLEDARTAVVSEIAQDGAALKSQDADDRGSSAIILQRSMRLFDQLLEATPDNLNVSAENDKTSSPIFEMLEGIVRALSARLDDEKDYGPIDMAAVLDIANELSWAAQHALGLEPLVAVA